MSDTLNNFKINTDLTFYIEIRDEDNELVPINDDELWFKMKTDPDDSDDDAIVKEQGDLISMGASGTGYFHLTKTQLEINPGLYFYEFKWLRSNGEERLFPKSGQGRVSALKRVWD